MGKVFSRVPEIRTGNAFCNLIIILDGIKILNHRAASLWSQNSLPGYSNLYKIDKITRTHFRESKRGEKGKSEKVKQINDIKNGARQIAEVKAQLPTKPSLVVGKRGILSKAGCRVQ